MRKNQVGAARQIENAKDRDKAYLAAWEAMDWEKAAEIAGRVMYPSDMAYPWDERRRKCAAMLSKRAS